MDKSFNGETLPLLRPFSDDENIKLRILGLSKTVKVFAISDIFITLSYTIMYYICSYIIT